MPFPIGATEVEGGVNFSVFSKNSTKLELLLFENDKATIPSEVIEFDPVENRTGFYWHIFIPGVKAGQIYGYLVHGPFQPNKGHRFNPEKLLLDPYSKSVVIPADYRRSRAKGQGSHIGEAMKSVVVETVSYNWEDDRHPRHPFAKTIIYELHVGGFTKNPNSGLADHQRGTYAGLIEKIPYLKELGITAVELLPVFQFDVQDAPDGLTNYWGYSPVSFFAPHREYSSDKTPLGPINEFRDMVKALHKADIEVLLDVVYNHTAEGAEDGPTFCFRGIENKAYYLMEPEDYGYTNFAGTGNTVNANHSVVRRMIMDSLRFWVADMHVDGFRFDLASILSRDEFGKPQINPPILWEIESDPVLAGTKLIAEAWDASGLYQVGSFVGDRWKEWNGKFRDDVRKFIKGETHSLKQFVSRLLASPDLYLHREQHPELSVNFVTCHDGFTLNDLVSYNQKHNEANKEDNRDGSDQNFSWNCGIEGPSTDPVIEQLRVQQIKNFLTITVLSFGTPMLLMGDEVRRTQHGNNNAYCQDNELSWFDWALVEKNNELLRFVKLLNAMRLERNLGDEANLSLSEFLQFRDVVWHGVRLNHPDWSPSSHSIGFTVLTYENIYVLHVMINAYSEDLDFEVPQISEASEKSWHRLIDTSMESPEDINRYEFSPVIETDSYYVKARSLAILIKAFANS